MDWTQVFTIIGVLGPLVVWLHSQTDKRLEKLEDKISLLDTRISRMEGVLSVRENWWDHHHKDSSEG